MEKNKRESLKDCGKICGDDSLWRNSRSESLGNGRKANAAESDTNEQARSR